MKPASLLLFLPEHNNGRFLAAGLWYPYSRSMARFYVMAVGGVPEESAFIGAMRFMLGKRFNGRFYKTFDDKPGRWPRDFTVYLRRVPIGTWNAYKGAQNPWDGWGYYLQPSMVITQTTPSTQGHALDTWNKAALLNTLWKTMEHLRQACRLAVPVWSVQMPKEVVRQILTGLRGPADDAYDYGGPVP